MTLTLNSSQSTRLASFRTLPAHSRPRPEATRTQRIVRRVVLLLIGASTMLTLWIGAATPAHAIIDDIKAFCGPVDVPNPAVGGSGLDTFLPGHRYDTGTYAPKDYQGMAPRPPVNDMNPPKVVVDIKAWEQNGKYAPSYHRYGLAGLQWNAWGDDPGCFSMNRWFGFIPNLIFSVSKLFAGVTMSLIQWAFSAHPFQFLEPAIGSLANATSAIAGTFLGILGIAGAMYLWWKNWAKGRLESVLKGIAWMILVVGAFLWFQANPMKMASNVNSVANDLTGQAFTALADLPTNSGSGICKANFQDSSGVGGGGWGGISVSQDAVTTCAQDAFYVPLVYQPWLYGAFGNDKAAQQLWGPQLLNAQYIGTAPNGQMDADGKQYMLTSLIWNAHEEIGAASKHGSFISGEVTDGGGPRLIAFNPWLQFWGYDVCAVYAPGAKGDLSSCWNENDRISGLLTVNSQMAGAGQTAMGTDFSTRMDAAWMSVWGGIIINLTVWFICAMLLAVKMALLVLMVFAPIYLMLGAFPGPSRVAAIKLAEMLFANLVRQVSWGVALVLVAYLDTMIMGSTDVGWFWKICTCAIVTILLAIYARPAMRAISGLAVGNKEAGGAIEGQMANAAKTAAKTVAAGTLAVGLAGAGAVAGMKGASQAAASSGTTLTSAEKFKSAALGITRAVPGTSRIGSSIRGVSTASDAGRLSKTKSDLRSEEKLRSQAIQNTPGAKEGFALSKAQRAQGAADHAAQVTADTRRAIGDEAGAASIEQTKFDRHVAATGQMHADDPKNPAVLEANRLAKTRDSLGQSGSNGVRRTALGSDLAAKNGLPTAAAASKNIDKTAGIFGGINRIDPTHKASGALREFAAQAADGAVDETVRNRAIEAVAMHGVPDQIDKVGLPSHADPTTDPRRLRTDVQALSAPAKDPTAAQRVQHASKLEALARQVPVGSQVNTALNEWRDLTLGDPAKATPEAHTQLRQAVVAAAALSLAPAMGADGAALVGAGAPVPALNSNGTGGSNGHSNGRPPPRAPATPMPTNISVPTAGAATPGVTGAPDHAGITPTVLPLIPSAGSGGSDPATTREVQAGPGAGSAPSPAQPVAPPAAAAQAVVQPTPAPIHTPALPSSAVPAAVVPTISPAVSQAAVATPAAAPDPAIHTVSAVSPAPPISAAAPAASVATPAAAQAISAPAAAVPPAPAASVPSPVSPQSQPSVPAPPTTPAAFTPAPLAPAPMPVAPAPFPSPAPVVPAEVPVPGAPAASVPSPQGSVPGTTPPTPPTTPAVTTPPPLAPAAPGPIPVAPASSAQVPLVVPPASHEVTASAPPPVGQSTGAPMPQAPSASESATQPRADSFAQYIGTPVPAPAPATAPAAGPASVARQPLTETERRTATPRLPTGNGASPSSVGAENRGGTNPHSVDQPDLSGADEPVVPRRPRSRRAGRTPEREPLRPTQRDSTDESGRHSRDGRDGQDQS